jgi:hypothetical protein
MNNVRHIHLAENGCDKNGIVWRGNEVATEPGDLAPHKVLRSIRSKFQDHGFELDLHGNKSLREKKSTVCGALSKLDKMCGVK